MRRFLIPMALVAPLFATPASAVDVGLGYYKVSYGAEGLWNDGTVGAGLRYDGTEVTYPGTPWTLMSITSAQTGLLYAQSTAYNDFDVLAFGDYSGLADPAGFYTSASGTSGVYVADTVQIVKREIWDEDSHTLRLDFVVTNVGCDTLDKLVLMHAIDPDQGRASSPATFNTVNDTVASGNLVWSADPNTKLTVAYGVCDPDTQSVGHTAWQKDPTTTFYDDASVSADRTMHIREKIGTLGAGESTSFSFLFVGADSPSDAVDYYYKSLDAGACCADCEWDADTLKYDYSIDARDVAASKPTEAKSKVATDNDRALEAKE